MSDVAGIGSVPAGSFVTPKPAVDPKEKPIPVEQKIEQATRPEVGPATPTRADAVGPVSNDAGVLSQESQSALLQTQEVDDGDTSASSTGAPSTGAPGSDQTADATQSDQTTGGVLDEVV